MKVSDPKTRIHRTPDVFTDREEPRRLFWERYEQLGEEDVEVIQYYGLGGIGKSTLLRKLRAELKERGRERVVTYDFEDLRPKDSALWDLSRQLIAKCGGMEFPLFEYALEKYNALADQGSRNRQKQGSELFLDKPVAGDVLGGIAEFIPYGGAVTAVVKAVARIGKYLAEKYAFAAQKDAEIYQAITEENDPKTLFGQLQMYFAADAYSWLADHPQEPLVIMLDGYEKLVNYWEQGEKAKAADLWLRGEEGLVMSLPRTLWVIAGRDRLAWDAELLPAENVCLIGDMSQEDAAEYFRACGVDDEALVKALAALTGGTPVYMDLCVRQYRTMWRTDPGKMPAAEDFGRNTEEIALRFLRDLTPSEQQIMQLLSCLPGPWTDDQIEALAGRLKIDFSLNEYRLLKELSMIQPVDSGEARWKLHEIFRRIVFRQVPVEEKRRMLEAVKILLLDTEAEGAETVSEAERYELLYILLSENVDLIHLTYREMRAMLGSAYRVAASGSEPDEALMLELQALLERLDVEDKDALRAYCASELVWLLDDSKEPERAMTLAEEWYEKRTLFPAGSTAALWCIYMYANLLFYADRDEECGAVLEEAMAAAPFTGVDPFCLWNLMNLRQDLAAYSDGEGQERILREKILETCRRALDVPESEMQDRGVRKVIYQTEITALLALDRPDDAERAARLWSAELRRDPKTKERDLPYVQQYLGKAYRNAGLWEKALPLIRESRLALEELEGKDDIDNLLALSNEGMILYRLDRDGEAAKALRELLDRLKKLDGRYPYLLCQTRVLLAGISVLHEAIVTAIRQTEAAWTDREAIAAGPDEGVLYQDLETDPERLKAMLYQMFLFLTELDLQDPEAFCGIVEEFAAFIRREEMDAMWSEWIAAWRAYGCKVRGQLGEAVDRYRRIDLEALPGPILPAYCHLEAFAQCLDEAGLAEEAAEQWMRLAAAVLDDWDGDVEEAAAYNEKFDLGLTPEILEAAKALC